MRISDWSSDVCSSDLAGGAPLRRRTASGAWPESVDAHWPEQRRSGGRPHRRRSAQRLHRTGPDRESRHADRRNEAAVIDAKRIGDTVQICLAVAQEVVPVSLAPIWRIEDRKSVV